jgi:hypothetical protein
VFCVDLGILDSLHSDVMFSALSVIVFQSALISALVRVERHIGGKQISVITFRLIVKYVLNYVGS